MDRTHQLQNKVKELPEFVRVKDKMGIDVLRRTITKILAEQVKKIMPELKQKKEEELKYIRFVSLTLL